MVEGFGQEALRLVLLIGIPAVLGGAVLYFVLVWKGVLRP